MDYSRYNYLFENTVDSMQDTVRNALEFTTHGQRAFGGSLDLKENLAHQQVAITKFLELYLEVLELNPTGIRISEAESGSSIVKLNLSEKSQESRQTKQVVSRVDFSNVSYENLTQLVLSRSSRWPQRNDPLFEVNRSEWITLRFAPLCPYQFSARVYVDSTVPFDPALALDQIKIDGKDRILPLLELEPAAENILLNSISSKSGIALVNRPEMGADVSAQSIVSALRPDCIIIESEPTNSDIANLLQAAKEHLILFVMDESDGLTMLQKARAVAGTNREQERLLVEALLFLYIHKRVRRNCPNCTRQAAVSQGILEMFPTEVRNRIPPNYSYGSRCADCSSTGFRGTLGINSIGAIDSQTKQMLLERQNPTKITYNLLSKGCSPLIIDGLNKIRYGLTTFSEVTYIAPKLTSDEKSALREASQFAITASSPNSPSLSPSQTSPTSTGRFQISSLIPSGDPQPSSLLVIEDDPEQREILRFALTAIGYAVHAVGTAKEGLDSMQTQTFDLVVTDFNLPDLNGIGLAKAIRQDPRNAKLPVLMLTSQDDPDTESIALDEAVDEFCSKHVNRKVLLSRISKLLVKSKEVRSRAAQQDKPLMQLL